MMEFLKNICFYSDLELELLKESGDSPLIRKHSTMKKYLIKPSSLQASGQAHSSSNSLSTVAPSSDSTSSPDTPLPPSLDSTVNNTGNLFISKLVNVFGSSFYGASQSEEELALRTLSLKHYKGHKLPSLPLIMLVHGLGGQLNQFEHLIEFFSHFAEVLTVDLPGHGQSEYGRSWKSYTTDRLVDTLEAVLNANSQESREVVLIGHSMGTVLAAKFAARLGIRCVGLIVISPLVEISEKSRKSQAMAGYVPTTLFNIGRAYDRTGGLHSHSVCRQVDQTASEKVRRRQLRWNLQANTLTVLNCVYSITPASEDEWKTLECPVFIIVAENDTVIPAKYGQLLHTWLGPKSSSIEPATIRNGGHAVMIERPEILCGIIGDFIIKHIDIKLSLGWQLAYLAARDDKWSLKNEGKWRATQNVSSIISGTRFRAMKTLRQDDDIHNPMNLEQACPDIMDIIDISRESPPYDPTTFTRVKYHKFPTVSKLPPTIEEVDLFNKLVDEIYAQRLSEGIENSTIVVHCHYGFNRTGFFLCCNMIEKLGFSVKNAVTNFKEVRDPGIKHVHFIDELYVRYEK